MTVRGIEMKQCSTGWKFWKGDPHDYGLGKCDRCGVHKRCGAQSPGLFMAYRCTRPINHDMADGHRQGSERGANAKWGKPLTDDPEWARLERRRDG